MTRYLVTSALPYANGPLHLGHLAGVYLPGDIYVRYLRMRGEDVLYICGTDEHGVAITIAAEKQGRTPKDLVDEHYSVIRKNFEEFGISFDNFSRTTREGHYRFAQEIFLKLLRKNFIAKHDMKQLYCMNCKRFLPDRYIHGTCPKCGSEDARGDLCESCGSWLEALELVDAKCSICENLPEPRKTTHWFLKLNLFQDWLTEWFAGRQGWRENVLNYCKGWLKDGLRERAITRDLDWGIPVPLEEAKGKVLYVWFENLLGYISSTIEHFSESGNPSGWEEYWKNPECRLIHFIGKDNIVFHAINFPAMLHSLGDFTVTWNVPANEFLGFGGSKQSTSRGTAIWMKDYLEYFPPDPMRYALAINAPENRDTDFSWIEFRARNNELADVFGNFVNRTVKFLHRQFNGVVPPAGVIGQEEEELRELINRARVEIAEKIEKFRLKSACAQAMDTARECNRYFDRTRPWKTAKENPERCAATINCCLQAVNSLRLLFAPFLPFTSEKIGKILGISPEKVLFWKEIGTDCLPEGHVTGKPEILFQKLDEGFEKILENEDVPDTNIPGAFEVLDYENFMKFDIRVGLVTEVHEIEKADKLYRLVVDMGDRETRQIVAGMRSWYSAEEMTGRKLAVVTNLKPVKIKGVISQGMLLASDGGNGVFLLEPGSEAKPGDRIR